MPPSCTQTDRHTHTGTHTHRRTNKGLWAFTANCSGIIRLILYVDNIHVALFQSVGYWSIITRCSLLQLSN